MPGVPQRPGPGQHRSRRRKGRAGRLDPQLHESGDNHDPGSAKCPGRRCPVALLVHLDAGQPRMDSRTCRVRPEEIEMPPMVFGLNHCAGILKLNLRDGRDARAGKRARHRADRTMGTRDL